MPGNSPEDRELTSRLYGGDNRTRIRQELVLGVGGVRALQALGITPGVYHLNEGHSAFATLEAIRERMKDDGMSFDDSPARGGPAHGLHHAHARARRPRPLRPRPDRRAPGPLRDELGISYRAVDGPGPRRAAERARDVLHDRAGPEAVAAGQRRQQLCTATSRRRMWAHLWPWRVEEEIPIGHITNGVHIQSWLAWQMQQLYDRYFPADWMQRMGEPEVWQDDPQRRSRASCGKRTTR